MRGFARILTWLAVCLAGVAMSLALAAISGTGVARAAGAASYDLTGDWVNGAPVGGSECDTSGSDDTLTVAGMNVSTGVFAGSSVVSGVGFAVAGTESGVSVTYTLTEGGYVSTVTGTVSVNSGGDLQIMASWHDTNGNGGSTCLVGPAASPSSTTSVSCARYVPTVEPTPTAPSPTATCTVSVAAVDADDGMPTGTVDLSTTSGTLSASSCALSESLVPNTAICSAQFTPATPVPSAPPTITASYGGDNDFDDSQGKTTLACGTDGEVQLTGISTDDPDPFGYRVGSTVTLTGCGFNSYQSVDFGTPLDDGGYPRHVDLYASGANQNMSADGTSVTITVPIEAATGQLVVADDQSNILATLPDSIQIDSFRNTDGLSFGNYPAAATSPADFVDAFGAAQTLIDPKVPTSGLNPQAALFYNNVAGTYNKLNGGICAGFALTSAEFAQGLVTPASLGGSATTAWGLGYSPGLARLLVVNQWRQWGAPYQQTEFQTADAKASGATLKAELDAIFQGNPLAHPAIILMGFASGAHTVVAYGDSSIDSDGDFRIYVADSDQPFSADEDTNSSGHHAAVSGSTITVHGDGTFTYGNTSTSNTGGLDISDPSIEEGIQPLAQGTWVNGELRPATTVSSMTSPGHAAPFDPNQIGGPVSVKSVGDGTATGSDEVGSTWQGPKGAYTETLTGKGSVDESFGTTGDWGGVDASAGTDVVSYDSKTGAVGAGAPTSGNASRSVTLTAVVSDGTGERVATLTGTAADGATVQFAKGAASVEVRAKHAGTWKLTLDNVRSNDQLSATTLASVKLAAGAELNVTPPNWTKLASETAVPATLTIHAKKSRIRVKAKAIAPKSAISKASLVHQKATWTLRATVKAPKLATNSSVTVLWTLSSGKKKLAHRTLTLSPSSTKTVTKTFTVKLAKKLAPGDTVVIDTVTNAFGVTPTQSTVTKTLKVPEGKDSHRQ